jgi:hypothetical protein
MSVEGSELDLGATALRPLSNIASLSLTPNHLHIIACLSAPAQSWSMPSKHDSNLKTGETHIQYSQLEPTD